METDLHAVDPRRASSRVDEHKHVHRIGARQPLFYMHSAALVHRDMKPANLLLNSDCLMKAPTSASRARCPQTATSGAPSVLTDYVATRWYRAPERCS